MNKMLFEFYCEYGTDNRGRSFIDMINMTDLELEKSHTVIQWLFPLKEPSAYNPTAPLLDDETIQAILNNKQGDKNLFLAGERICEFLLENFAEKPTWIKLHNHNFLRMTRIIKCYTLFGIMPLAKNFHNLAMYYYQKFPKVIGEETIKFWNDAITCQHNNVLYIGV